MPEPSASEGAGDESGRPSVRQKIVVIEDDCDLSTLLEYNLGNQGYDVVSLYRLDGAYRLIEDHRPDLIILDVMLPDGDGFEFCRELRSNSAMDSIPVIFLTARSQELDRVLGLEIGGDDYITKPFSPRELVARVKAHLRRGSGPKSKRSMAAQGLEIDHEARTAQLNGNVLELTATEFAILTFFASNPGKAYTRQQLISRIWDRQAQVAPRNIDVHVRRLREQIEDEPKHPRWIKTVRGFGYRFEIP